MKYSLEELLPLVTKLSKKYTSNESTSVTYEVAEQLMGAILYCINENKKGTMETEEFSSELINYQKNLTAEDAYNAGYELVMKKARRANELNTLIGKNFCAYGNRAYSETVIDGMPEFFKYYDAKFSPQDHLLTLDYPTILPIEGHCGIDAIYLYLQYIALEQKFLSLIPYDQVITALMCYHNEYEELFINICSVVLRHILRHIMNEKGSVEELIASFTDEQLLDYLKNMVKLLVDEKYEGELSLYKYLSEDLKAFILELRSKKS